MKHLAAYMLCNLGGNAAPSQKDVTKVLSSVGIQADNERLAKLLEALSGKDINELMKQGISKLASVPSGGAVVAAAPAAATTGSAAPAAAKKEEKKEESDDDMGFGLFD